MGNEPAPSMGSPQELQHDPIEHRRLLAAHAVPRIRHALGLRLRHRATDVAEDLTCLLYTSDAADEDLV